MRHIITIDIETLPALQLPQIGASALCAGKSAEDHLKSALNGDFGRILCLGLWTKIRVAARSLA
jgi:hypothetical protein